jgi:hypothetical protein
MYIPPAKVPGFEKNVEALGKKKVIGDELSQKLADAWDKVRACQKAFDQSNETLSVISLTMLTLLLQLEQQSESPAPAKSR